MRAGQGGTDAAVEALERAVSDALFDLLCNCDNTESCEPSCQANEHYADLGPTAIAALRSLPVEQRMEAMGMTKWDDVAGYEPGTTVPVWIVRDAHV